MPVSAKRSDRFYVNGLTSGNLLAQKKLFFYPGE